MVRREEKESVQCSVRLPASVVSDQKSACCTLSGQCYKYADIPSCRPSNYLEPCLIYIIVSNDFVEVKVTLTTKEKELSLSKFKPTPALERGTQTLSASVEHE